MKLNLVLYFKVLVIATGSIWLLIHPEPSYQLVWSDEFDYDGGLDLSKWTVQTGDGCPQLCGFGNNELQYYKDAPSNVRIENGVLLITARKEKNGSRDYTSAKLISKGKGDWLYGKFEVRAKLPAGRGTWPAIWMLPTENDYGRWPRSGEIDIMENVGFNPGTVYGTVHTYSFNHMKGTQKMDSLIIDDADETFHVYSIEWTNDKIDFYVDEQKYHTFSNTGEGSMDWPFDRPFYYILNLAVGGNWGGKLGVDDSIWPQTMEIDYVRVYQKE